MYFEKLKLSENFIHVCLNENLMLNRKPIAFLLFKNNFYIRNLYASYEAKNLVLNEYISSMFF